MKSTFKYITISTTCISMILSSSCTDLDTKVYSEVTDETFGSNPEALNLLIGSSYVALTTIYSPLNWWLNELSSDVMHIPFRNVTGEWQSVQYRENSNHEWTPNSLGCEQLWTRGFNTVTAANLVLDQIKQMNMEDEYRAKMTSELRMIRACAYYNMVDLFGDVPLITTNNVDASEIVKSTSAEIYEFMLKEFEECLPHLSKERTGYYGRMHYYASVALKARYLINANVFLDTDRNNTDYPHEKEGLDECIDVCSELIESGVYSLESDYFANFKARNENSKENILIIPLDEVYSIGTGGNPTEGHNLYRMSTHASEAVKYSAIGVGWNGYCALPSMYKSFADSDIRRNGWNIGQQYAPDGTKLMCKKEKDEEGNFLPLNFTIDWDTDFCHEYDGARLVKYEFEQGLNSVSMNNDFPVIRYADIILIKAEALMRKNDWVATQEAVNLVNQVWNRSNPTNQNYYTTTNLTKEMLLQERRREFYAENVRRTDLVRFHSFVGGSWEQMARPDESYKEYFRTVFCIPQSYLNVTPKMTQNEGY